MVPVRTNEKWYVAMPNGTIHWYPSEQAAKRRVVSANPHDQLRMDWFKIVDDEIIEGNRHLKEMIKDSVSNSSLTSILYNSDIPF